MTLWLDICKACLRPPQMASLSQDNAVTITAVIPSWAGHTHGDRCLEKPVV